MGSFLLVHRIYLTHSRVIACQFSYLFVVKGPFKHYDGAIKFGRISNPASSCLFLHSLQTAKNDKVNFFACYVITRDTIGSPDYSLFLTDKV